MSKRRLSISVAASSVVLGAACLAVYFGAFDAKASFSCSNMEVPPTATRETLISEHVIGDLPELTDSTC